MLWQLSYHFLITVRRREKIAAGRPTSFTWLRKSYSKYWIGKLVLGLPDKLQEPAFMMVQYMYALGTMVPCPIWFWYRWPSATFLLAVFIWSIYNGATFYIDIFGKRFQNELEQLKKDVAKWQNSPDMATSPEISANAKDGAATPRARSVGPRVEKGEKGSRESIDRIPLLDSKPEGSTGLDRENTGGSTERRAQVPTH